LRWHGPAAPAVLQLMQQDPLRGLCPLAACVAAWPGSSEAHGVSAVSFPLAALAAHTIASVSLLLKRTTLGSGLNRRADHPCLRPEPPPLALSRSTCRLACTSSAVAAAAAMAGSATALTSAAGACPMSCGCVNQPRCCCAAAAAPTAIPSATAAMGRLPASSGGGHGAERQVAQSFGGLLR
jgi:hypothetical protein